MYPQEKPAEKCEKYMTLLPVNAYKKRARGQRQNSLDGSKRHYLNSK